jgi:acetyltransferase
MAAVPPLQLLGEWTWETATRDGADITVRPMQPSDVEREREFFESLSEDSRYFRMLTPMKHLPPQLLSEFVNVDYDRRMALAACVQQEGRERFVGVARYGPTERSEVAELGIAVTDAWQHRGVATLLITALTRFARVHGFRSFTAVVLPENMKMLALARKLGFAVTYDATTHLMHISRELPAAAP